MAISGSLEDVSVADVMQFIHLGRRTGVLELLREGQGARVGFHAGKLVSAHGPRSARLGDLLIQARLVPRDVVLDAIGIQQTEDEPRTLGQILLAMEAISPEDLKRVISDQIESTISDLVHWDRGTFEFIVDDHRSPIDDIALYPSDLLPDADINTQMVLLEAARLFDERNRDAALPIGEDTNPTLVLTGFTPVATAADTSAAAASPAEPLLWPGPVADIEMGVHRLQLVTADESLGERLSTSLPPGFAPVERVAIRGAGRPHPGHETPIVILDLRDGAASVDDLARLRRIRRGTPLIALVPPHVPSGSIYQAGALAALPVEIDAIVACLSNLVRNRRRSAPAGPVPAQSTESVARLRRVFGDLRSGLISATVALNLMHIISESVERAVLFLVRRDHLTALGAFGAGIGGRPLAELTRGLHLPLEERHALTDCIQSGEVSAVTFSEIELPASFSHLVGEPANGQAVIFPVLGTQRVIAVIYTDNGENEQPIEDIEILELATAQVGMAFENELLRRQISQQG